MATNVKVKNERKKTFSALVYKIDLFDALNDDDEERKQLKEFLETAISEEEIFDPSDYDYKSSSAFDCAFECIEAAETYFIGRYGEIKDARYEFAKTNFPGQLEITYQVFFIVDYNTRQLIFIYNKNANNFAYLLMKYLQKKNNTISLNVSPVIEKELIKKIKKSQKICSGIIMRKDSFEDNIFEFMKDNFKYSRNFKKVTLNVTFDDVRKEELIESIENGNLNNIKLKIKNEDGYNELLDFTALSIAKTYKLSLSPLETNNIEYIKELLLGFIT